VNSLESALLEGRGSCAGRGSKSTDLERRRKRGMVPKIRGFTTKRRTQGTDGVCRKSKGEKNRSLEEGKGEAGASTVMFYERDEE